MLSASTVAWYGYLGRYDPQEKIPGASPEARHNQRIISFSNMKIAIWTGFSPKGCHLSSSMKSKLFERVYLKLQVR